VRKRGEPNKPSETCPGLIALSSHDGHATTPAMSLAWRGFCHIYHLNRGLTFRSPSRKKVLIAIFQPGPGIDIGLRGKGGTGNSVHIKRVQPSFGRSLDVLI
jgi:hypothetical protein